MDQHPPPPPQASSLFEMDLDALAQNHLRNISRWGKFIGITLLIIAILGAIGLAASYEQIMARLGEMMSINASEKGMIIGVVIFVALLGLLSLVYLLRACAMIKQGLLAQNSDKIAEGFKSLKTFFTVSIIFSVLSILGTVLTLINNA